MFFNRFDSYYYSRPVSYRSYNPRIQKPEILAENDVDTRDLLSYFQKQGITVQNLGGLSRGIRFGDIEIGKRQFNHHATASEYYIHQWKPTNDLQK
jgi:hypothetical protein